MQHTAITDFQSKILVRFEIFSPFWSGPCWSVIFEIQVFGKILVLMCGIGFLKDTWTK